MKTSTIPSLCVKPELRLAAEKVLHSGETLSSFIEQSLLANIEKRLAQTAFLQRGLTARDQTQQSGQYFSFDEVISELEAMLEAADDPNHQ